MLAEFSIVVPTYRRPLLLESCLNALCGMNYERNKFEVIVVDDGSDNPPNALVKQFESSMNISLLKQQHCGPAAARNAGAKHARHPYVAFTDDDCAPLPEWLNNFSQRFQNSPDAGIGGHTLNGLPDNSYSTASQLLTDFLYSYYNSRSEESTFFASNNLAFPRDAFLRLGGFDSSFPRAAGEDREFCDRWLRNGLHLIYASEVTVFHHHALSLTGFWKQHLNYGRAAFHYHKLRSDRKLEKIRVEPFRFYFEMFRYPFKYNHRTPAILSFLMGLSQIANAAGFFSQKIKS